MEGGCGCNGPRGGLGSVVGVGRQGMLAHPHQSPDRRAYLEDTPAMQAVAPHKRFRSSRSVVKLGGGFRGSSLVSITGPRRSHISTMELSTCCLSLPPSDIRGQKRRLRACLNPK